jgi:RNA-directed DNA polymerase
MASITWYPAERLSLTVNRDKSAVARPWKRSFLGYTMTAHKKPLLKVADRFVE